MRLEMMSSIDGRYREMTFTLLWLVGLVMVCLAFVLNDGTPVLALGLLAGMFFCAFIVALVQMFLNPNGPSRLLFFLLAGAWVLTALGFGREWLYLDPGQMKGWLLACMALVALAIAGTWWEEVRWRRCGTLLLGGGLLWAVCGASGVVSQWLDRGERWDVGPVEFRDPFFLAHEDGERLIAMNLPYRRMPGEGNVIKSYRNGVVVQRVPLHVDLDAITVSLPWSDHFAILQTINTHPPTARGPAETWVDVFDAALSKKETVQLPPTHHMWTFSHPHFRFGSEDSSWWLSHLVEYDPSNPMAVPPPPERHDIMLWNSETGESRTVEDYWGGNVGGWVDQETLSHVRIDRREEQVTPTSIRIVSSTIQVELLNIQSGEVTSLEPMTFDGMMILRWQYRDQLTFATVRGDLTLIDWRDRSVRNLGRGNDGRALHVMESRDGVRAAWATGADSAGSQTLNVMDEDGLISTLEGLKETVSDVWLSPDPRRVLFSQTRNLQTVLGDRLPLVSGALRVWDVENDDVTTIHHRGFNDSTIFARPASMRYSPGCSPWSSDGRRVAIVHTRVRFAVLERPYYVLRVVEVGEK